MKFILSGDTHGTFDLDKIITFFQKQNTTYTKEDYLIICGDTGICGYSETEETKVRHILRNLPVTTLFIDGNHEDFEKLKSGIEPSYMFSNESTAKQCISYAENGYFNYTINFNINLFL